MCKKATLAVAAVLVVGGLLFGGKLIPYAKTAYRSAVDKAQEAVPIEFQIEAAKDQLKTIGPEINDMVRKIAREKVEIKQLENSVAKQETTLKKRYDEMMVLRNHIQSGDTVYVATNGAAYTNERVREDLKHRFSLYQTAERTLEKEKQILELRQQALSSAFTRLDEAQAQQRELEVQIENLTARNRVVEVTATASQINNFDNSQLSKTREMIDEISSRIDTKEEMLSLAPKYFGQIPVSEDSIDLSGDILDEMDAYFNQKADDSELVQSDQ